MALADMFVSKFHMRLFIRLLIRCLREKTTVVLRCFGVLQWIRIIVLMQRRSLEILRGLKTVHVVDPLLAGEDDGGVAMFRCVAVDKDNRPDAKEIAGDLKRIKTVRLGEDDVAKD
ncbi:hypothetical protein Bca52824_051261 [Brassica carinata]|uniref:Uncharacterized protein n=1 Tax=Brassica carinata TaxID=52824 RepID=A0A8X7UL78_BRACI|nr:hypothetical protein Bca52824_051261 [Brassica carinata]